MEEKYGESHEVVDADVDAINCLKAGLTTLLKVSEVSLYCS